MGAIVSTVADDTGTECLISFQCSRQRAQLPSSCLPFDHTDCADNGTGTDWEDGKVVRVSELLMRNLLKIHHLMCVAPAGHPRQHIFQLEASTGAREDALALACSFLPCTFSFHTWCFWSLTVGKQLELSLHCWPRVPLMQILRRLFSQGIQTPRWRKLELAARREQAGQVAFHSVVETRDFQSLEAPYKIASDYTVVERKTKASEKSSTSAADGAPHGILNGEERV